MKNSDSKPLATQAVLDDLKDLHMRAKTDQDWTEIRYYTEQFDWYDYPFYEGGKCGIKNVLGKVLVPCEFDDYVELFSYFAHCGAIPMKRGDVEVLVKDDGSGDVVPGTEYPEINAAFGSPFFEFWKGDLLGFIDAEGRVLVDAVCDQYYEFTNGVAAYHVAGGKWGAVLVSGDVLPAEFDAIDMPEAGEWLHVKKGGKWGFVTEEGCFTLSEAEAYWGVPDVH